MILTREEAIRKHRAMWNWIADEIEKGTRFVSIYEFKYRYISLNDPDSYKIKNLCYLCEHVKIAVSNRTEIIYTTECDNCPLEWPNGECKKDTSLFARCNRAYNVKKYKRAAELARQIANLPEREEPKDEQ